MTLPARHRGFAAGAAIVLAAAVAYLPATRNGFVWDDEAYVAHNQLLTQPDGLRRIWFTTEAPSQYFPLVYTTFRLEHAIWGPDPVGYHAVNIALHAANAVLLWLLLLSCSIPGAWIAALLFAVHPVQVESVAWISERKNVLSTFFSLLTVLAWLRHLRARDARAAPAGPAGPALRWGSYAAAICCYALALFSKTTVVSLPFALLLLLWFRGERIGRRRLAEILPFLLMGLAMGLVTLWWERFLAGTRGPTFDLPPLERVLIAGRAFWFYLGKLAWPVNLTFSYPRWSIAAGDPVQYLWPAACLGAFFVLWRWREALGRGPIFALAFFGVSLLPLLGFIPLYTFRYTFVADHYQYVACVGPLTLLAAGLSRRRKAPAIDWTLRLALPAVLVATCAVLTWRQTQIYRDGATLWRDTAAKNPASWMAFNNLGSLLAREGRFDEALARFEEALRVDPRQAEPLNNAGKALYDQGNLPRAVAFFRQALLVKPDFAPAHNNLGMALFRQGENREAIRQFREAVRASPNFVDAHNNLGIACEYEGRLEEAAAEYREVLRLLPLSGDAYHRLGTVLRRQGRLDEALAAYRQARKLLPEAADVSAELGALEREIGER